MHILPRLRYILEVCRPTPTTVRWLFAILTRIARHSVEACHEITKCPRMLETIFSKFLPSSWKRVDISLDDVTDMYGLPSHEALRLLRAICSGGRHLSSLLVILCNYNSNISNIYYLYLSSLSIYIMCIWSNVHCMWVKRAVLSIKIVSCNSWDLDSFVVFQRQYFVDTIK